MYELNAFVSHFNDADTANKWVAAKVATLAADGYNIISMSVSSQKKYSEGNEPKVIGSYWVARVKATSGESASGYEDYIN